MAVNIRENERKQIYDAIISYRLFNTLTNAQIQWLIKTIERGLYNTTIDKAKEHNIPVYWHNNNFVARYTSLGYTLKMNIDINSSVNQHRPTFVREYVASRIYAWFTIKYLRFLVKSMRTLRQASPQVMQYIGSYIPHFDPEKLAGMPAQELNPLINEPYILRLQIRAEQSTKIKYSKMYSCYNCGEKKTKVYELQTRSLDEGGTLFIECLVCGCVRRSRT